MFIPPVDLPFCEHPSQLLVGVSLIKSLSHIFGNEIFATHIFDRYTFIDLEKYLQYIANITKTVSYSS